MHIPEERLKEFQDAYKADFNEDITIEQAKEMLCRLTAFYEFLLRPLPGEEKKAQEAQDTAQEQEQKLPEPIEPVKPPVTPPLF